MPTFKLKSRDHIATPSRKRDFNQQLFSAIAREYTWMSRILSFGRDTAWKRALIEQIPKLPSNPACLDLACGHGELIRLLHQRVPKAYFTGVDLTAPMLAEAKRYLPTTANVQLLQGDMTDTQLPAASFDLITVGYGLRNAPDLKAALVEIYRLLTPGGYLAVLDFSRWNSALGARLELTTLRVWCGFWGVCRSGNPDTYAYIADSLTHFPYRRKFHNTLTEKGLQILSSRRHCLGIIETLVAKKVI